MQYGQRVLQRNQNGDDVEELQIRLSGFRGTFPDGDFGPGTELQVVTFQKDFMKMARPSGIVDSNTLLAIDDFAQQFPIDFNALKCPCQQCSGFGQERFKGKYRSGKPKLEMYYLYEYPGVHRLLLWAARAVFFYAPEYRFTISSGYRCSINNEQKGRKSTNHHGKAIDLDISQPVVDKRDDMIRCDRIRGLLVEKSAAQIGWNASNRKALEPSNIAPTWVHYDVRCFEREYLQNRFFCTSLTQLDNRLPIDI